MTSRGKRRVGTRKNSSSTPMVEQIVPIAGWTEDPTGHCLLVELPEFKKEEVKLQIDDSSRRIIVKGERQTNEEKRVRFELTFPVPTDSDMDNIAGNFNDKILYAYVPKKNRAIETEKASNGDVERPEEIESEEHDVVNEERDRGKHDRDREKEEIENENENAEYVERFSEELTRKWEQECDMSKTAVYVLRRNWGIVITAVVAFSFGLYISHKFHS